MILTSEMATTWTQGDIDSLKSAIGTGVMSVTYAGPPQRIVQYHSLAEMRSLLAEMLGQVNAMPRYSRIGFSKGFDPTNGSGGFGCG